MVVVQAETARLATPGMPTAGAQKLLDIGDTARAALTEMRRLLGVLREDTQAETADRQPQMGLPQLIDLVDTARDTSGAAIRLILHGAPKTLDTAVELAAYRIIQEALTNARRHAPGAAVDVELHFADDGLLRLPDRDNGPGPPLGQPAGGHGLLGMREPAVAVGGELRTGAATGGGFLVTARLPGKEAAVGPIPGSQVDQTPKLAASPSRQTGTTLIGGRPEPECVAAMLSRAANRSRRTNWAGWTEAVRHANGVSEGLGDGGESRG